MQDEYGRVLNKAEAIRGMDKLRMAVLLHDVKSHPEKYPSTREEWLAWLNKDSGSIATDL